MTDNQIKEELLLHRRVQILPGEHFAATDDIVLSTLLGSCVAACLFDPKNRIVGMNHFLLANDRYPQRMSLLHAEAGRYGIHSMELLINAMLKIGASRHNLRAKAFGGGSILPKHANTSNFHCVGNVNAKFVLEFLENERIPLVAADLGGELGRVVHFFSSDYSVHVRKIKKTMTTKVADREQIFWSKSVKENRVKKPETVIWG